MRSFRGIGHARALMALTLTACAMLGGAVVAKAGAGEREAPAHPARTVGGTDTAHLHLVRQDEMRLFEEGVASGALPGHMRAELTVGSLFVGTCTIYTSGGSITGHGVAKPHGTGRYQSFSGSLYITGGSGRYQHIRGRTGLSGTFDRRTFALVVQTSGNLSY